MSAYRPSRLRSLPWPVSGRGSHQQPRRILQYAKDARAMPGIATTKVVSSLLPRLLQEGAGYSNSKLAPIRMAIMFGSRALVVGRHLTVVSAQ